MIQLLRNSVGQFLLRGINRAQGRRLETIGWQWARGLEDVPGVYFTLDEYLADQASDRLQLPITEESAA